eukprot:Nk52_evm2s222 gene=Nk52_evmTU2s222
MRQLLRIFLFASLLAAVQARRCLTITNVSPAFDTVVTTGITIDVTFSEPISIKNAAGAYLALTTFGPANTITNFLNNEYGTVNQFVLTGPLGNPVPGAGAIASILFTSAEPLSANSIRFVYPQYTVDNKLDNQQIVWRSTVKNMIAATSDNSIFLDTSSFMGAFKFLAGAPSSPSPCTSLQMTNLQSSLSNACPAFSSPSELSNAVFAYSDLTFALTVLNQIPTVQIKVSTEGIGSAKIEIGGLSFTYSGTQYITESTSEITLAKSDCSMTIPVLSSAVVNEMGETTDTLLLTEVTAPVNLYFEQTGSVIASSAASFDALRGVAGTTVTNILTFPGAKAGSVPGYANAAAFVADGVLTSQFILQPPTATIANPYNDPFYFKFTAPSTWEIIEQDSFTCSTCSQRNVACPFCPQVKHTFASNSGNPYDCYSPNPSSSSYTIDNGASLYLSDTKETQLIKTEQASEASIFGGLASYKTQGFETSATVDSMGIGTRSVCINRASSIWYSFLSTRLSASDCSSVGKVTKSLFVQQSSRCDTDYSEYCNRIILAISKVISANAIL